MRLGLPAPLVALAHCCDGVTGQAQQELAAGRVALPVAVVPGFAGFGRHAQAAHAARLSGRRPTGALCEATLLNNPTRRVQASSVPEYARQACSGEASRLALLSGVISDGDGPGAPVRGPEPV